MQHFDAYDVFYNAPLSLGFKAFSFKINTLNYRSAGVTGEFLVGGRPRNDHEFHKLSCYITQDDLLQPLMTVGELMNLAAALKLPSTSSTALRKSTVDDILRNLGLVDQEHTRTEALSGGQKKR